jgi:hypothetical protein
VAFSKTKDETSVCSMSRLEVAELQLLHFGHIWSMEVAFSGKPHIVDFTKNGMISEGNVSISINMELTPNPFFNLLCIKMLLKMSKGFFPSSPHCLLLESVSSERKMYVVEDALLHLMETDQTHFLRTERFHQMI